MNLMSFLIPILLPTGPVSPYVGASLKFRAPTLTNRDFHILLVAKTVNISVNDLKQSREKIETSRKNW